MSKKHYIAVAEIFAGDLKANYNNEQAFLAVRNVCLSMAQLFQRENERFDRATFFKACGLTPDGLHLL